MQCRGAEFDFRLIASKLNIKIQLPRQPQGTKAPNEMTVSRLNSNIIKQSMAVEMSSKLDPLILGSNDIESDWEKSSDTIYAAAAEVIGSTTYKDQDWLNENNSYIQALLEEKYNFHRTLLNDPASTSKNAMLSDIWEIVQC